MPEEEIFKRLKKNEQFFFNTLEEYIKGEEEKTGYLQLVKRGNTFIDYKIGNKRVIAETVIYLSGVNCFVIYTSFIDEYPVVIKYAPIIDLNMSSAINDTVYLAAPQNPAQAGILGSAENKDIGYKYISKVREYIHSLYPINLIR